MTVTVDGTLGVTTPSVKLVGTGTTTLLSPTTAGTYTQNLPAGDGILLLTQVVMNFPTYLGSAGDILQTDGAGNLSWVAGGGGGSGTVTSVTVATVAGMGLSWTGTNPITTSGTFTLGGTLNPSNGGTGLNTLGTGVQSALGNATNNPGGFPVLSPSGVLAIAQGGTGNSTIGASGTTLVSNGTAYVAGYPARATNVVGGNPWEVLYQTATNATGFVAAGVTGQVLGANTGAAPAWVSGDILIGTDTLSLGGAATTVLSGIDTINLTQDPTSGLEAATKQYVDAKTSGLQDIGVAKAASNGTPVTLNGPQTVDGVSLVAGDICLVKNQALAQDNGLYQVNAGAWTYASTASTWADYPSAVVFVQQGTTNANTSWIQTNLDPAGIIGTTTQSWVIQSSPVTSYSAGTGINIATNVISNTGVLSVSGGSTGLTFNNSTGACSLQGQLAVGHGGTGLSALGTGVTTALANATNAAGGFAVLNPSGVVPIAQGGTGGATVAAAQANLLPAQSTNNTFLKTDGAGNLSWASVGTVTSVDIAITAGMGLTATGGPITNSGSITIGGTLSVANGGTGATTASGAITALLPTQTGHGGEVLSTNGLGVLSWVAVGGTGTVTSVSLDPGSTGLTVNGGTSAVAITGSGTFSLGGSIAVTHGGTGLTSIGSAGQVLTVNPGGTALVWASPSGSLTIGSTGVTGGTTGDLLYQNGGVLGAFTLGANVATALGIAVGTAGSVVVNGGALGTPTSGTLTNCSGLSLTSGVTNTLPIGNGGTGISSIGASGTTLVSDGTNYSAGYPARATNVSGGNPWEVHYQSAANTTAFVAAGTTGQVLTATTGAAPAWGSGSITVGTTSIALGGTATTIGGLTTLTLTQDPTSGLEAATKQYVDAKTAGLQDIGVAKAATTGDITRSGPQTIDTIPVVAGDIVLVKNQTLPQENGLYEVQAGAWTYASSANTWAEYPSAVVFVQQGATNANTSWIQTDLTPAGTLGTTPQSWVIQSSPVTSYSAGTGIGIAVNVISNTGVLSVSGGSTGLTFNNSTGACSLQGTLSATNGGTGVGSLGTGVSAALGNNVNSSSGFVTYNGTLGTAPVIAGATSGTVTLQAQATASGTLTLPNGNGSLLASSAALTSGSVLYAGASGVISENNAAFFWDNSNKTLKIGTTSAASGLITLFNASAADGVSIASGNNAAAWTFTLPVSGGTNGQVLTTNGSGATSWTTLTTPQTPKWVSAATSAVAGDEIWVDSSGAGVTITLPASPAAGTVVTVNRIGANNVTVGRNGSTILGSATDFVINVNHNGGRFVYLNSTWQVQKTQLGS